MTATYTTNEAFNGIEISFPGKPAADILAALKSNGFRWHSRKAVWYAKNTPERMKLAQGITGGEIEAATAPAPKSTDKDKEAAQALKSKQAQLKAEYIALIEKEVWPESPSMVEHVAKHIAYIVELEDGGLIEIEKPTIETRFCFGESGYDADKAMQAADYAKSSEEYFISENMRDIEKMLEWLKKPGAVYIRRGRYCGCSQDSRICSFEIVDRYERARNELQRASANDTQAIIAGYEQVKKDFRKRLNVYLKRYGMSKIRTWTYWADA